MKTLTYEQDNVVTPVIAPNQPQMQTCDFVDRSDSDAYTLRRTFLLTRPHAWSAPSRSSTLHDPDANQLSAILNVYNMVQVS